MPKSKALQTMQDALPDTKKFIDWTEEWLSSGNATKAALKTYDCKSEGTAAAIGSQNLRKLKNAGQLYLESKGVGYTKLLDVAVQNMVKAGAKTTDWWDRIIEQTGMSVNKTSTEQPDNLKRRVVAEEFFGGEND